MKSLIRVVMLSHGYYPRIGGVERQLEAVLPLLQSRGVEPFILTRRLPGTRRFEMVGNAPIYRLPVPGPKPVASMMFTLRALPLIKSLNPHLIHAHELISPATTAIAARSLFNIPIVGTVHGSGLSSDVLRLKRRILGRTRLSIICRDFAAFCVISAVIDRELAAEGVPAHKRIRIPNGVDIDHFAPLTPAQKKSLRSQMDFPADARVVIYVGRIVPEKRVDLLISIWSSVIEVIPRAHLLIVGSGFEEIKFKNKVSDTIHFVGNQVDVLPFLQAADLFVLPSIAEGLSLALLEALACGLPVIATSVGGNPEVIQHGETGWLIPPDDPQSLTEAIITLFKDELLQSKLRENARTHAVQNYSLVKMADRLIDLYRQVIDGGPSQV